MCIIGVLQLQFCVLSQFKGRVVREEVEPDGGDGPDKEATPKEWALKKYH